MPWSMPQCGLVFDFFLIKMVRASSAHAQARAHKSKRWSMPASSLLRRDEIGMHVGTNITQTTDFLINNAFPSVVVPCRLRCAQNVEHNWSGSVVENPRAQGG
ncbi:hypothetical protein BJ322DRAFT_1082475 [Thelephora terrestris]|uniref:Secreted protein n=1 Tax=Thelephora terrestris TaxID=56493 RepID=A0A9P6L3D6_9AGAM|nr:hypothetical protein BJ322DRAFT_1082475 [Thelephora terrestris]